MGQFDRKAQSARKHPLPPSSGSSKAPVRSSALQRPGWKGPSIVRKAAPRQPPRPTPSQTPESTVQEQLLPVELQQLLLNVFRSAFPQCVDFEGLKPVLQEINQRLGDGDSETAHAREDWREAYAVRWSPSRGLGYGNLLAWMCEEVGRGQRWVKMLRGEGKGEAEAESEGEKKVAKVVCLGGGAAEVVAFGALLRYLRQDAKGVAQAAGVEESLDSLSLKGKSAQKQSVAKELVLVDAANWESVVSKLYTGLTTVPELSKYASATARANNAALVSSTALTTTFKQTDILTTSTDELREIIGPEPALITLLFTLNDLYTTSIPKTTKSLLELTAAAPRDSLLLVVDSPGSYSETSVGAGEDGEKKKYPMQWLMDYVLLDKGKKQDADEKDEVEDDEEQDAAKTKSSRWEKVVGEESRVFKLDESLRYPASLENLRFQVHLFRKL